MYEPLAADGSDWPYIGSRRQAGRHEYETTTSTRRQRDSSGGARVEGGTARADANHFSFSYTIGPQVFPAGTLCDFKFESSTIGFQIETDVSNALIVAHGTQHNTHTNLDTGYSLTEVDQVTSLFSFSSPTTVSTGIFWHLRDAQRQQRAREGG
jgi:hypothetical protein